MNTLARLNEFLKLSESVSQMTADLNWLNQQNSLVRMFSAEVESISKLRSPFEELLLHDRLTTVFRGMAEQHSNMLVGLRRHNEAHLLVSASLPQRGWYLSGHEPCTLSLTLADAVRSEDWQQVDQEVSQ